MSAFEQAQKHYDAQLPPDDESCEKDCDTCGGSCCITINGVGENCPDCGGTGVVESHVWRRIRSDGEVTLMRRRNCGAEEVS